MPATAHTHTVAIAARRGGKTAFRQLAFDKALHCAAPRLTRRQRHFLSAVAGMRAHDAFDLAVIEPLEAPAWDGLGLVRFEDSAWKRWVGRKRQMSSSYRLTDFGRHYVLAAARQIEGAK